MPSVLTAGLTLGAWIAICIVILVNVYLFYKEVTRPKPLDFYQLFMYMEQHKENLEKLIKTETDEVVKEIFKSELRNYDRIRRKLEKLKSKS